MNNIIHISGLGAETAALVTQIPNRRHNMYKVIFESGYQNIFFTDVETGRWIEEDLGFTSLAKQVGEAVKKFSQKLFHVPKILAWHKQYTDGKLFLFGFFTGKLGHNTLYEIYFANKKYLCSLVHFENGEWEIIDLASNKNDAGTARLLTHIVKTLSLYYTET